MTPAGVAPGRGNAVTPAPAAGFGGALRRPPSTGRAGRITKRMLDRTITDNTHTPTSPFRSLRSSDLVFTETSLPVLVQRFLRSGLLDRPSRSPALLVTWRFRPRLSFLQYWVV